MVEHTVVIIHFVVIKSKWVRGGGRLEGTNFLRHRFLVNIKENIEPGL